MVSVNDPEIPKNINVKPGADHSQNDADFREKVVPFVDESVEALTPAIEQKLNTSNLDGFLDAVGAKEPEVPAVPKNPQNELEKLAEGVSKLNPFNDETDETGTGKIPVDLEEEKNKKMEEKKAA